MATATATNKKPPRVQSVDKSRVTNDVQARAEKESTTGEKEVKLMTKALGAPAPTATRSELTRVGADRRIVEMSGQIEAIDKTVQKHGARLGKDRVRLEQIEDFIETRAIDSDELEEAMRAVRLGKSDDPKVKELYGRSKSWLEALGIKDLSLETFVRALNRIAVIWPLVNGLQLAGAPLRGKLGFFSQGTPLVIRGDTTSYAGARQGVILWAGATATSPTAGTSPITREFKLSDKIPVDSVVHFDGVFDNTGGGGPPNWVANPLVATNTLVVATLPVVSHFGADGKTEVEIGDVLEKMGVPKSGATTYRGWGRIVVEHISYGDVVVGLRGVALMTVLELFTSEDPAGLVAKAIIGGVFHFVLPDNGALFAQQGLKPPTA